MYKYFVSYSHKYGFGRCEVIREELIKGIKDIEGIEKAIREGNKAEQISVLCYQLFVE